METNPTARFQAASLSLSSDPILFTPGPLTTSRLVKQALLRDMGSRDREFLDLTQSIRKRLVKLAGCGDDYTAVLLPGSGTYSVEAVLTSTSSKELGHVLVISNGAYGKRMIQICRVAGVPHTSLEYLENEMPKLSDVESALKSNPGITQVAMVHCETTSGIFNPINEVGALAKKWGKTYFVDAMSSFGAYPISFQEAGIDYLVSSANKCIEGVPGFAFVIARRGELEKTQGWARSLSFDLYSQWKDLERAGEFRFTPPIQTILGFDQALNELEQEGGVSARAARYRENYQVLVEGMSRLGFKTYLPRELQGYIITSFRYFEHPKFNYQHFYERLRERGVVIYSGKVTDAECFRVGSIGRIFARDVQNLLGLVRETLLEMGVLHH